MADERSALSIQMFGCFSIALCATRVRIDQPRLQRLVAYLLLHRRHARPRQQIAFTLWPDTNEEQALKNLRTLLTRLRQSLPGLDQFLEAGIYALHWRDDAACDFDVAAFEDVHAAAIDARQRGQNDAAISMLQQTTARYTGDLTPGWYDEWLVPERERLRDLHQNALHQLAALLAQTGCHREALDDAQQLLRVDPLHEAAYRQLMQLHLKLDDRARALRVYHTCATTLRNELGGDPGPATQALYLRVLTLAAELLGHALPPAQRPSYSRARKATPCLWSAGDPLATRQQLACGAQLAQLAGYL